MASPIIQTFLAAVAFWLAFRLLKYTLKKDPLAIIPGPPSESFWTGNLLDLMDANGWDYVEKVTGTYGRVFRFNGLFNQSGLFVHDPKALHHIVVKDQHIYEETSELIATSTTLFGLGLLATLGDHHRKQRKLLNPVFSIAHMRDMTPTFFSVVEKLRQSITSQVAQGPKEIDILSWMTRTALELIGQSGYGYSFDSLEEGGDNHPFSVSLKNLTGSFKDPGIQLGQILLLPNLYKIGSPAFQRAVVNLVPWKKMHEIRDMIDVMHNTSVEIFEATKRSLDEKNPNLSERVGGGKDIMSTLLKANMSASEEDRLPESELLAQVSTLTFAAMDTTSNAISRILHLLTEHPDVQDRLRKEISDAQGEYGNEQLDYDTLTTLPYLDAVIRETLRLYAPIPYLQRRSTKDMILPFSQPIVSTEGKPISEIHVPKGTLIIMSLQHCNRNPEIWGPDSLEWKPERWLSPLPDSVTDARVPGVYSNLMTFLGGGRACIGFKFSQLEIKVVLSLLLPTLKFAASGKKIEWNMNTVVQPTTEDAKLLPNGHKVLQLPLNVSLV